MTQVPLLLLLAGCIHIVLDVVDVHAGGGVPLPAPPAPPYHAQLDHPHQHQLPGQPALQRLLQEHSHGVDEGDAQQHYLHPRRGSSAGGAEAQLQAVARFTPLLEPTAAATAQDSGTSSERVRHARVSSVSTGILAADAGLAAALPSGRLPSGTAAIANPSATFTAGVMAASGRTAAPGSRLARSRTASGRFLRQARRANSNAASQDAAAFGDMLGSGGQASTGHRGAASAVSSGASSRFSAGFGALGGGEGPGGPRLAEAMSPVEWVELLGSQIAGGGREVLLQLPQGGGAWNVRLGAAQAAGAADASAASLAAVAASAAAAAAVRAAAGLTPPDLTCVSPPCVVAGAPGPLIMYAAGTDLQTVVAPGSSGRAAAAMAAAAAAATESGPAGSAAAAANGAASGGGEQLAVHVRYRGSYLPVRASLLGDQMPVEALSRVLPLQALQRAEVLCLQLPAAPAAPGLMFVECSRGGLLGAALPVLVAPNLAVSRLAA